MTKIWLPSVFFSRLDSSRVFRWGLIYLCPSLSGLEFFLRTTVPLIYLPVSFDRNQYFFLDCFLLGCDLSSFFLDYLLIPDLYSCFFVSPVSLFWHSRTTPSILMFLFVSFPSPVAFLPDDHALFLAFWDVIYLRFHISLVDLSLTVRNYLLISVRFWWTGIFSRWLSLTGGPRGSR